jgi:hypothetical protein
MPEEEHPVPRLAKESEQIINAIGDFFNPVEKYFGPHEAEDWPRDLTRGELAGLISRLNLSVAGLAWTFENILREEQPNVTDPEKAKQVREGVRLLGQAYDAIQAGQTLFGAAAGQPSARTQQELAAENFPRGPAAGPQPGSGTQDASRQGADITARQSPDQRPGTGSSTASAAPQPRPRRHL